MFSFTSLALPLGLFWACRSAVGESEPRDAPAGRIVGSSPDGQHEPAPTVRTAQVVIWILQIPGRYLETLLRTVQWIVYMSAPARRCHCVLQSKKASESAQVQSSGHVVIRQGFEY